jgi:glucose-1-phosphate adenylyltransferase
VSSSYAMILAGGLGNRLCLLSERRAKPAVPFGGKYRIIDFTLSNCVNSGIYDVGVLTQYRPLSLHRHIGFGRPWDLDRKRGGVRILQPYLGWRQTDWYKGTADAVYQNRDQIRDRNLENVFILSGDHVYRMFYGDMLRFHEERHADATIGVVRVAAKESKKFGMVRLGRDDRVTGFEEKPERTDTEWGSMGVYVFRVDPFLRLIEEDAQDAGSAHDFGRSVLPRFRENGRVYAYRFDDYWQDIGTLDSFFEANLDLTRERPKLNLNDPTWTIHTVPHEAPPAFVERGARIERSLIANGGRVAGTVCGSVLFPHVRVETGAVVRDSIVMEGCVIGAGAALDRVILDKEVVVGEGARVGYGGDQRPNVACPEHLSTGITLVGMSAVLPKGIVVGRNCRIGSDLHPEHFPSLEIPSGGVVDLRPPSH